MTGPSGTRSAPSGTDAAAEVTVLRHQLENLTRALSHDVRAPLRGLDIVLRMLRDHPAVAADSDLTGTTDTLLGALSGLLDATGGLIELARIDGDVEAPEPVSLDRIIATVLEPLDSDRVHWVAGWPTVRQPPAMLMPVFRHLIANAATFSQPPAMIELAWADATDSRIRITTTDRGIGIRPAYLDAAFELCRRVHGGDYPGCGIGLAVVRRAVERMGGSVSLASTVGQGTTATVVLPRAYPATDPP